MNKKRIIQIIIVIAIILLGGIFIYLKKNNTATMENRINVTTSFYPIYFLASQIGGDLATVTNLTPAGIEPHDYDLTSNDIVKIKKSRMLILNGGGLEIWANSIKKNTNTGNLLTLVLGDDLMNSPTEELDKNKRDPHIWLSPMLALEMAKKITNGFIKIDPRNKDYYQTNLSILTTKLLNLDSAYRAGLKDCKRRDIITSHNAFGYLTQAYGLKQVSIAGLSVEEEPSTKQLVEVSQFAKENNIKYIFFESLVSPKLSQVIAKEVGAQTLILNPIEGLNEEEIAQGKNYLTAMEKNLENLKIALECN